MDPKFVFRTKLSKKLEDYQSAVKFHATNQNMKFGVNFDPNAINKDGKEGGLELELECNHVTKEYDAKAEFKFGGFKLGPLTMWKEVSHIDCFWFVIL